MRYSFLPYFTLWAWMFCMPPTVYAGRLNTSTIRISNTSMETVYCTFYYKKISSLSRASKPVPLPSQNAVTLALPKTRLFCSRVIAFTKTPYVPDETNTQNPHFLSELKYVGFLEPDDFTLFVSTESKQHHVTATEEWEKRIQETEEYRTYVDTYRYATQVATVSTNHSPKEDTYIAQRMKHVHTHQNKLLNRSLPRPLRIGICASGGGFRALLTTLGAVTGLADIGLLDTVSTFAGLSGSTWAVLPWIISLQPLSEYITPLTKRLSRGLLHTISEQYDDLARTTQQKKICNLPISAIDLYGIGLSHTLLKPLESDHTQIRFADLEQYSNPTLHPLPICTAATRATPDKPYTWLTFSPFRICQCESSLSIPSWALGRSFWNGTSTNQTPPPSLGYAMGMFGSSFSISLRDILDRTPDTVQRIAQMILPTQWYQHMTQARWANTKITAAYLPHFTYGYKEAPHSDQEWLCIVDGGYLNNIPLYPLLHQQKRPFDLIFIIDSKRERNQRLATVRSAYEACNNAGYQLASLSDQDITEATATIRHGDANETAVCYITLEPDASFDATFNPTQDKRFITQNLFYSTETSMQLLSFVRHTITSRKKILMEALREIADGHTT